MVVVRVRLVMEVVVVVVRVRLVMEIEVVVVGCDW